MANMDEGLYRIEETIIAEASSNLAPGGWALDHVMALGLAGQRNRLGYALVHLIDHANEDNLQLVKFMLAGEMERGQVCKARDAMGFAQDALRWWADRHCPNCGGRGVMNFQQAQCPVCMGAQDRPRPNGGPVSEAIGMINQALQQMEGQLRHRLGNIADHAPEHNYKIRAHAEDDGMCPEEGMVTPAHAPC